MISLLSKGLSRVFSNNTVQKHQPSLALSLLYGPVLTSVHDYWKNHSFDLIRLISFFKLCWKVEEKGKKKKKPEMFDNYQESNRDLNYSFCENTRASQLMLSSELKERGENKQDRKVVKRGHCGLRRPVHSQKSIYKALFRGRVKTQARPLVPSRSSATGRSREAQLNQQDQGNWRRSLPPRRLLTCPGLPPGQE